MMGIPKARMLGQCLHPQKAALFSSGSAWLEQPLEYGLSSAQPLTAASITKESDVGYLQAAAMADGVCGCLTLCGSIIVILMGSMIAAAITLVAGVPMVLSGLIGYCIFVEMRNELPESGVRVIAQVAAPTSFGSQQIVIGQPVIVQSQSRSCAPVEPPISKE